MYAFNLFFNLLLTTISQLHRFYLLYVTTNGTEDSICWLKDGLGRNNNNALLPNFLVIWCDVSLMMYNNRLQASLIILVQHGTFSWEWLSCFEAGVLLFDSDAVSWYTSWWLISQIKVRTVDYPALYPLILAYLPPPQLFLAQKLYPHIANHPSTITTFSTVGAVR